MNIGFPEDTVFSFASKYTSLRDVMMDHKLASLGDTYVNFMFSLSLSESLGEPMGRKVSGYTLSSALKRADLRRLLPARMDRHMQADAAEALIVYSWITGLVSLKQGVETLMGEDPIDGFALLLKNVADKVLSTFLF